MKPPRMRLTEACKMLGIPYQTAYNNLHKLHDELGIRFSGSAITCSRRLVETWAYELKDYELVTQHTLNYMPREKRIRELIDCGYVNLGCFGFVISSQIEKKTLTAIPTPIHLESDAPLEDVLEIENNEGEQDATHHATT